MKAKFIVTIASIVICFTLAVVVNLILGISIVYTHLFYIPIIFSGIWFPRYVLAISAALGVTHIVCDYMAFNQLSMHSILRASMFMVVATVIRGMALKQVHLFDKLGAAEETYRNIFLNAQVGMFRTELETGLALDVNDALARFSGYRNREEMLAERVTIADRYVNPEDREKMISLLKTHGEATAFEAPFQRSDGSIVFQRFSARLVPEKGWIEGVSEDITKERQIREALKQSEAELKESHRMAGMGRWDYSHADDELRWTETIFEIFEIDSEKFEATYEGFLEAIHPDDRNMVNQAWIDSLEDKKPYRIEHRLLMKDGRIKWVAEQCHTEFDEQGRPSRSVGIVQDVTDRKKAEGEREKLQARLVQAHKMEAIGTLAGGIAHDFNNILSIIVGNTEIAMMDVPEWNPAQGNLKQIRDATLRTKELVKQILLFARQKEHTVTSIPLEPIAKESLRMLRASIPTTVEIRENIEEGLPSALADPSQIQQIIMNLCTNAGQAMEADGGTLTFTLDSVELDTRFVTVAGVLSPGQYLCMKVSDTGPGIPPGIVERIFDPFFTTKGVGEGTGMGLAVVHGIVQDRKGGIIVDSEEGRGTTFTIYLPASEGQSVEVKAEQETEVPRGTERILFVDDEPMLIKMGRQMLERLGYNVETRASGTDALECFRLDPHRFDLVITDMTMPGMRGDRLAEEILASRKDIPIILCTGYSTQTSKVKAEETGIRAFVMKPLTQHELANTVRRVLDEKPRK